MTKRNYILLTAIISIILFVISSTYAAIIEVTDNEGIKEIINVITIKDLLTNDNNTYNKTYYIVINELDITREEADILMNSESLNNSLKEILNSIVSYQLEGINKLTNEELLSIITTSINKDNNINESLKNKVINKSTIYINDISNYIYSTKVLVKGNI